MARLGICWYAVIRSVFLSKPARWKNFFLSFGDGKDSINPYLLYLIFKFFKTFHKLHCRNYTVA